MTKLKKLIRGLISESAIIKYHYAKASLAAFLYGHPARHMVVIGITGTKGKTSTANFIWSVLDAGNFRTGLIGTANIRIGNVERMNPYHMTMPGPFITQKILRDMQRADVTHVVMEVTSEGLKLGRHTGIDIDVGIFTNLSPEHLPNHGNSFEKYKMAKGELFRSLSDHHKVLNGKYISKIIIANADSEDAPYYLGFDADEKITFGLSSGGVRAEHVASRGDMTNFVVDGEQFNIAIVGKFNVYNALPAIILGRIFGVTYEHIKSGLENLSLIPGRMERIDLGQPYTVFVDYAHEKLSMRALLDTAREMKHADGKIIVILGAEGGGRDKAKREHLGTIGAELADIVIVTTVDPYDDEPQGIIDDVARFAENPPTGGGKVPGVSLFTPLDRREAIKKAIEIAREHDIVLITGKGAEQSMVLPTGKIPWDDRVITREIITESLKR